MITMWRWWLRLLRCRWYVTAFHTSRNTICKPPSDTYTCILEGGYVLRACWAGISHANTAANHMLRKDMARWYTQWLNITSRHTALNHEIHYKLAAVECIALRDKDPTYDPNGIIARKQTSPQARTYLYQGAVPLPRKAEWTHWHSQGASTTPKLDVRKYQWANIYAHAIVRRPRHMKCSKQHCASWGTCMKRRTQSL